VIKQRGNRWWVVVYAGRDPLTGRKRQKTGTGAVTARCSPPRRDALAAT
jgi:hypothetical protein